MIKFYKEDWHGVKKISKKKYRSYLDALSKYEGNFRKYSYTFERNDEVRISRHNEKTEDGRLKCVLEFGDLKIVAVFDDWKELEEASKW